ncbi:hypothetical protein [Pseudodesulfovibrio karagichevae]|uniref:Uncharacterized protein n=1 Tax=Pseudodesulfovibrio karagichevae TaxID=3239305 RepID=A0ABV4JXE8_9BACT
MQDGLATYSLKPREAGCIHLDSLSCLLKYVNGQAIEEMDSPLIGITEAALALLDKIREEIAEEMAPLSGLSIVRYNRSEENIQAGVADKFVNFEVRDDANFQITMKKRGHQCWTLT